MCPTPQHPSHVINLRSWSSMQPANTRLYLKMKLGIINKEIQKASSRLAHFKRWLSHWGVWIISGIKECVGKTVFHKMYVKLCVIETWSFDPPSLEFSVKVWDSFEVSEALVLATKYAKCFSNSRNHVKSGNLVQNLKWITRLKVID